ncbi:MAG: GTPase domain-containing protein [Actinobacteria bacterium]|nr:GTPase domain-containing protein [Actinomycetota bacterium]
MALVNVAAREVHCKLVYYGPGFGGKTSNLLFIHEHAPTAAKGDLLTIATETERTLFFDFLPLDLGSVDGFRVRFHLYTVPGQPLYERTRIAVLSGADGVVFVADSQRSRFRDTVLSFLEMERILAAQGKPLADLPHVLQYNKRDAPDAVPVPVLDLRINPYHVPSFEAVATTGQGVFGTLRAISKLVIGKL